MYIIKVLLQKAIYNFNGVENNYRIAYTFEGYMLENYSHDEILQ